MAAGREGRTRRETSTPQLAREPERSGFEGDFA
jgi:hypothetical protein